MPWNLHKLGRLRGYAVSNDICNPASSQHHYSWPREMPEELSHLKAMVRHEIGVKSYKGLRAKTGLADFRFLREPGDWVG
jgi:hypothetical protein